jgi:two-component system, chemotaxis family, protein-glutamate methylesterase/glutaminase
MAEGKLKVLVVDDSALSRSEIAMCISASGEADVVAMATNGAQALQLAHEHQPDLITLDLEMPDLDGFGFLRVIPTVWRCPVIVVSSLRDHRNVLHALELGAVDFLEKPTRGAQRMALLRQVLSEKLRMVRALSPQRGARRSFSTPTPPSQRNCGPPSVGRRPNYLVGITASTGGPPALKTILSQLRRGPSYAVLVAQHMPDKFTTAMAQRLNEQSRLEVSEASDADPIFAGRALICPGRHCLEVVGDAGGLRCAISRPSPTDRYVPSGNRLLASLAAYAGRRAIGVILTGMGDDGVLGAREIARNGGFVIAESEETALVYGMPKATVEAGIAHRVVALEQIASLLNELTAT